MINLSMEKIFILISRMTLILIMELSRREEPN
jgi:hypothetical protein